MEWSEAVRHRIQQEHAILPAPQELDLATAAELEQRLRTFEPNIDLVIDLSPVCFCDSSGLRCLIRAHNRFAAAGGSLTLSSPPPLMDRLLSVCGLDKFFTIRRECE